MGKPAQLMHLKSFVGIELFVNVLQRNEFFSSKNCNFYYFPSPFVIGAIRQTSCLTFQTVQVFLVHLFKVSGHKQVSIKNIFYTSIFYAKLRVRCVFLIFFFVVTNKVAYLI